MLISNKYAARTEYPDELREIMNIASAQEGRNWLSHWSGVSCSVTPIYDLPDLAVKLGVSRFCVKDESVRSPLASFKALGAPIAMVRQILREHPEMDPTVVLQGRYGKELADFTVISATDGNHGRGLAAAARDAGCKCVIVLHGKVSEEREEAIAAFGAKIVRIGGNYDESVEEAERLARTNGWQVISDTSYEGYENIPRDVMQGYSTIAAEIVEQTESLRNLPSTFTHVLLQGGVGGMAAGVVSYLWEFHGEQRPQFIVVEPKQADCLLQSALQGHPAKATGSIDSVMAGLACGDTSPLAWKFLQPVVDHLMTIEDEEAVAAMSVLAKGSARDIPIVSGESGAAGLAAVQALLADQELSARVDLGSQSSVLIISTEGATAPKLYEELVGESASSVLSRQASWVAGFL